MKGGDQMLGHIEAPIRRTIKEQMSEFEKNNGIFCVRSNGERKIISYSDIPDNWSGRLVCVKNRDLVVTKDGWFYYGREPEGPYLKIVYPEGSDCSYKIFKLDEDLITG